MKRRFSIFIWTIVLGLSLELWLGGWPSLWAKPPPDLVMTAVSTTTTNVPVGGSLAIAETVANQGNSITTSGFYVGLYLSVDATITTADTRVGERWVSSLATGATSPGTTTVTVPTTLGPGTYYIGAIADYDARQAESNEANNVLAGATLYDAGGTSRRRPTAKGR